MPARVSPRHVRKSNPTELAAGRCRRHATAVVASAARPNAAEAKPIGRSEPNVSSPVSVSTRSCSLGTPDIASGTIEVCEMFREHDFFRDALTAFNRAVHEALILAAGVFTGKKNAAARARELPALSRIERLAEERVPAL